MSEDHDRHPSYERETYERGRKQRSLEELPDCVWEYWRTRTKEDISRIERWGTFIVWFETSSRYTRGVVIFLMAGFGLYTAAMTLWARWMAKG